MSSSTPITRHYLNTTKEHHRWNPQEKRAESADPIKEPKDEHASVIRKRHSIVHVEQPLRYQPLQVKGLKIMETNEVSHLTETSEQDKKNKLIKLSKALNDYLSSSIWPIDKPRL